MKLSEKERDILAFTHLQANVSIDEIRKATGYRNHTIRYTLKSLQDKRIISQKNPYINNSLLGYNHHNIFFSLNTENEQIKDQILEDLKKSKSVVWLAELGGDYQYAIDICARHVYKIRDLMNELMSKHGSIFFEKAVSFQFSAMSVPRTYLSDEFKVKPLMSYPSEEIVKIDKLDHEILKNLTQVGDMSHRALAQKMNVPLSTLKLRISKLEEKKVIAGYYYGLNVSYFGMQTYKLLIYTKSISKDLKDKIVDFAIKHRNISSFFECFGSWDYEINCEVEYQEEVIKIRQGIYDLLGEQVQSIKVMPKFRDLKWLNFPASLIKPE